MSAPRTAPAPPHRRPALVLLVAAGGVAGTFARHGLALLFPDAPRGWPATTFAVNIAGAFLLGLLLEALTRHTAPDRDRRWEVPVRLGVGTGALGAFTTYSALAVDTDLLLHRGFAASAVAYAAASVLLGVVACALGIAVGAWVGPGRRAGAGSRPWGAEPSWADDGPWS